MNRNRAELLALLENLPQESLRDLRQYLEYLLFREKNHSNTKQETRYLAHFEDSEGIFLIEDDPEPQFH